MTAPPVSLLVWEGGKGRVAIARLAGEIMEVHASAPSAPGSRPTIALPGGEVIRMKVHRCRAVSTGAPPAPDASLVYFLEGRLIDASRVVRAEIEKVLGLAPQPVAAQPLLDAASERTTLTGDEPEEK
jgi:hypothetical protein